ncbi:MAG: PA2778 family cysteine peptidase [Gammaproteobacteria bacterium]|nr:PA2778 family cysteine peptidase [Gammaproteobacteria bacterium]
MFAGVLFCAMLAACATPPQTRQLQEIPPSLPPHIELTETPFFPQEKYQCGPAALATVLAAQRIEVTPDQLVAAVYVPAKQGSLQVEMMAAARSYERLVYPLAPELTDLLSEVAGGNPVLVLQNVGLDWLPRWHYAVVVGYDLARGEIILRSGTYQRWVTPLSVFERTWQRSHHWAIVVVPPGRIPATAQPLTYLQAANDLETTGHAQAAYQAYQAATQRWPQHELGWMSLGNASYARGEYQSAIAAFRQAITLNNRQAAAWNNLAYALKATQCSAAAIQAVQCAVAIAPDYPEYQQSLEEIEDSSMNSEMQKSCIVMECPGHK